MPPEPPDANPAATGRPHPEGRAAPNRVPAVVPAALADELAPHNSITLIDVREPREWAFARLPGATHIPLGSLAGAVERGEIARDADIVVYCHHGSRSDMAARMLLAAGYERVRNLIGGIDRWSVEVDPSLPRY